MVTTAEKNVYKFYKGGFRLTSTVAGIIAAGILALSGWSLLSTVGLQSRMTAQETYTAGAERRLIRIEDKVDILVDRSGGSHGAPPRRDDRPGEVLRFPQAP